MAEIKKPDPIRIDSEKTRFKEHIDYGGNDRIIFSGIYGIGKTYFLKEFFKDNDDYQAFYLTPVNYSVSSNKDIFEYIKYDIAFALLSKDTAFEKIKFSNNIVFKQYIKNNKFSVLSSLLKNVGSVGKNVSGLIDSVMKLNTEIEKFKKEVEVDDENKLVEFCKLFTEDTGSIYEEDFITQLIKSLIETYDKKKVLVIDDFDRIDPEHIFRLLNVFAAHSDFNGSEQNKFGFDKIIIVCDIENIRNIYHSKYGGNVDFNGYIDKFYSMEIFEFNNKFEMIKSVDNIFRTIDAKEEIAGNYDGYYATTVAKYIIKTMIDCNAINLRSLLKFSYKPYFKNFFLVDIQGRKFSNKNIIGLVVFEFLSSFLGSDSNLHKAIYNSNFSKKHIVYDSDIQHLYNVLMVLADCTNFFKVDSDLLIYDTKISYRNNTDSYGTVKADVVMSDLSDLDINNFIVSAFEGYKTLRR